MMIRSEIDIMNYQRACRSDLKFSQNQLNENFPKTVRQAMDCREIQIISSTLGKIKIIIILTVVAVCPIGLKLLQSTQSFEKSLLVSKICL